MPTDPPRRPSPGPRPAAAWRPRPRPVAADVPARPAAAPRAWRRPGVRTVSGGAIVAGVAVFVVASALAPLAGADTDAHGHRSRAASAAELHRVLQTVPTVPTAAPTTTATTAAEAAKHRPAKKAPQASVDHTVISGLAANGIPSVALNAYRVAAARVDHDEPSCGIQWSLLAGIGREESDHGQFGGAVLHSDGISTPAIVGPALNGKGNQFIPAPPDGLALDGDAKYAHALGPMQFIPSTWAIYGTDADGDGVANIFDINDAALATARYLCAAGGDLNTQAGRVRAVFAYNHTDVYVAQVLALALAYQTGTPVTGLPHGNTTGSLPGLGRAGAVPPANPGAPTAIEKAKQKQARERAKRKAAEQRTRTLGGTTPASGSAAPTSSHPATHKPSPTKSRTASPSPSKHHSSGSPTSSPSPSPSPTGSACVIGLLC